MIFNDGANGLVLNQKYSPVNGKYKFQVLEMYDDLSPSYTVEVPEAFVTFNKLRSSYELEVYEAAFNKQIENAKRNGCREMYIYPKFS